MPMSGQNRKLILDVESTAAVPQSLTTLLSHSDHGVMANQAGDEGQRAGPQVLYHGRHECPSQGLFKRSAGRRVLCFVAVRDDDVGDPLLSEANGGENHTMN